MTKDENDKMIEQMRRMAAKTRELIIQTRLILDADKKKAVKREPPTE